MIDSVTIQNFKAIRRAEIALTPFTVFVGPNGSGKTTILQAIGVIAGFSELNMQMLGHEGIGRWVNEKLAPVIAERANARSVAESVEIKVAGSAGGDQFVFRFTLEPHFSLDAMRVAPTLAGNPELKLVWGNRLNEVCAPSGTDETQSPNKAKELAQTLWELKSAFGDILLFRPDSAALRGDCVLTAQPRMQPNGAGMADALSHLHGSQPDRFSIVATNLAKIIAGNPKIRFDRLTVEQTELKQHTIDGRAVTMPEFRSYAGVRLVLDFDGAPNIPASELSEGTLFALGILTAIAERPNLGLLLLDDLDRGLHPTAQWELIDVLTALQTDAKSSRGRELQILATTHSPLLLNRVPAENMRVCALTPDGPACRPLTDHPDFADFRDILDVGEFWSTVGESWIAKLSAADPGDTGGNRADANATAETADPEEASGTDSTATGEVANVG